MRLDVDTIRDDNDDAVAFVLKPHSMLGRKMAKADELYDLAVMIYDADTADPVIKSIQAEAAKLINTI